MSGGQYRARLRVTVNGTWDVSGYVRAATWSGSMSQPARSLRIELTRGIEPGIGDRVDAAWDGTPIFTGTVMMAERTREGAAMECMDAGVFLANNRTYREYWGTPPQIAARVCAEFGVPAGSLAPGRETVTVTSTGNMTAYQVLVRAYEGIYPVLRQYSIGIREGALCIEPMAREPVIRLRETMTGAGKSSSIREMINRVVLIEDAQKIGEAENEDDRREFGTFQETYTPRAGEDPAMAARARLRGPVHRAGIGALGDIRCIAGAAVEVEEAHSGLAGIYGIESDSHRFEATGHTMQLELRKEEA